MSSKGGSDRGGASRNSKLPISRSSISGSTPPIRRSSITSSDDFSTSEDQYESDDYFSYQTMNNSAANRPSRNTTNNSYQFPVPPGQTKQLLRPHRHISNSQKYKYDYEGEGEGDRDGDDYDYEVAGKPDNSSSSDNNSTVRHSTRPGIRSNKSNNTLTNVSATSSPTTKRYSRSSRHKRHLSNGTIKGDDTPKLGAVKDVSVEITVDAATTATHASIPLIATTTATTTTSTTSTTATTATSNDSSGTVTNETSNSSTISAPSTALNTPSVEKQFPSIPSLPTSSSAPTIIANDLPALAQSSIKKPGTMTVEAETVEAVPTLAVAPTVNNNSNNNNSASLKVKKSIDNVTLPGGNRSRKKKSSRLGQSSKAEIFAAKIASAVDKVHSSDSDETFVYESNPPDSSQQVNVQNQPNPSSIRPRFQSRNPSTSSLPFAGSQQLQLQQLQQQIQEQQKQIHQHYREQQVLQQIQQQDPLQAPPLPSPSLTPAPPPPAPPLAPVAPVAPLAPLAPPAPPTDPNVNIGQINRWVVTKHKRTTGDTPMSSSSSITNIPPPDQIGGAGNSSSSKRANKNSKSNSASESPRLSPKFLTNPRHQQPSLTRSSHYDSTNSKLKDATFRRWRRGGGNYMAEEDDDDDDDYNDQHGPNDIDDDIEYLNVNEATPLRSSGHSIRRTRKNGGLIAYSPHNYQRDKTLSQFYYFRVMFWVSLFGILVLAIGFILGFLLATSKPLQDIRVSQVFDVLVSDEVLAFELVIEGSNPGYLGIEVQNVNLDLFAKSKYVKDKEGKDKSKKNNDDDDDDDDESHTMLLGNVRKFDVPLIFEGGLFNKRLQKAVADVKLINPGRNTTGEELVESSLPPFPSIYEMIQLAHSQQQNGELDDGQKKWSRVNVHSFELILRGSLKYNLLFGRQLSASIAKVSLPLPPHAGPPCFASGGRALPGPVVPRFAQNSNKLSLDC